MNAKPIRSKKTNSTAPAEFYVVPAAGALRITGQDRQDFLQRQTTNDLANLSSDRPLVTVLTSPTARILDVLTLIESTNQESGESEYLVLTLPARSKATADFLQSKIFFMDKVKVEDVSSEFRQIEVFGPGSQSLFETLGLGEASEQTGVYREPGHPPSLILLRQVEQPDRLVTPTSTLAPLIDKLELEGALALSEEAYRVKRIEAGRPGHIGELTTDYTPLENNLSWAISSTKGCYTGQEVIARQITYDKVTRRLVGIRLQEEVPVGAKVWVGKQAAGTVTSTARSVHFGPIALAMVKRPHFKPDTVVKIGKERGVEGKIEDLPFKKAANS